MPLAAKERKERKETTALANRPDLWWLTTRRRFVVAGAEIYGHWVRHSGSHYQRFGGLFEASAHGL